MAMRRLHGLQEQFKSHCRVLCSVAALIAPTFPVADNAHAQSAIFSSSTDVRLTTSALPGGADGPVTFTASVTTDRGGGVPGGPLQFIDETTMMVLGWADVAHPSVTVDHLAPGLHVVRADYGGSTDFLPAVFQPGRSAALKLNVLKAPEVNVTSSQNPSMPGDVVTLTAAVMDTSGGAVTFRDGDHVLATHVGLDRAGTASFTTSALADGPRNIVAEYEGDMAHAPAVSPPLTQRVGDRGMVSTMLIHRRR